MTQYLHYIVIGGFILFILMLQLKSFVQNMRRMNDFKNTFGGMDGRTVFSVEKSSDIDYVSGISYEGSSSLLLERIISSLNMYLANNRANVIDFQLLKDTVDRNCDSVEEDINTQTPIPLYLGLAGTMFVLSLSRLISMIKFSRWTPILVLSNGMIAVLAIHKVLFFILRHLYYTDTIKGMFVISVFILLISYLFILIAQRYFPILIGDRQVPSYG